MSTLAPGAKFSAPAGVAQDKAGNYYVVDSGNQVVRQIDGKGNVSGFAGVGKPGFAGDGGAAARAQLAELSAIPTSRYTSDDVLARRSLAREQLLRACGFGGSSDEGEV